MTLSLTSILSLTRPLTLTRYISIWQLVLLAGLMQALLHYVRSTGLEPQTSRPCTTYAAQASNA